MQATGGKKVSGVKVLAILLGLMMVASGIMLFARAPSEDVVDGETQSFKYTWKDNLGKEHTVEVEYDPDDYERAVNSKINRKGSSSATRYVTTSETVYAVTDYVVVDKYIVDLKNQLEKAYKGDNPAKDVTGVDYANFLSTFVQKAIAYGYDKDVHGREEYWNYPLQTLVLRKGDCEDTSILLAALFQAAGYDGAVVLLPSHAMAAVSLPTQPAYNPKSYDFEGKKYYMVETTRDAEPGKPNDGFPENPVGEPEDPAMERAVHHFFPVTSPGTYV